MSEEQVQTREELIAKRDEVIEQLQGEWAIKKMTAGVVNRDAIKAGVVVFVAVLIFSALMLGFAMLGGSPEPEGGPIDVGEGLLYLGGFAFISAILVYGIVLVQAMWYQKLNPIVIDGASLVWAKKKGYVPERMDLCRLTQVIGFQGTGSSRLLIGMINRLGGGSFGIAMSPCIFYSQGDNNTPKFSPALFIDGDRLVELLQEIAVINTKLKELDEADKPTA